MVTQSAAPPLEIFKETPPFISPNPTGTSLSIIKKSKVSGSNQLTLAIMDVPSENFKVVPKNETGFRKNVNYWKELSKNLSVWSSNKRRFLNHSLKKPKTIKVLEQRITQTIRVRITGSEFTSNGVVKFLKENKYVMVDQFTFAALLKLCSTSKNLTDFSYLLAPYVHKEKGKLYAHFMFPTKLMRDDHYTYKILDKKKVNNKTLLGFVDVFVVKSK